MPDDFDPLLAPLARLMVARGVAFGDLAERLKGHYVQAALALAEDKTTDSRLSVMTGLQRRDIARLRAFEARPPRPNPLTRLVAQWQTDPLYAPGGRPAPLPRMGAAPSFESLARAVRQDVHPRTFLDTLEAAGTVRLEGDKVLLIETAYVPLGGSEDQIAYLAQNSGDHLQTAAENVLGRQPPLFERAVHYSGLTRAQAEALAARFATAEMALLEALSREAAAMKEANRQAAAPAETGSTEAALVKFRAGGYVSIREEQTHGEDG